MSDCNFCQTTPNAGEDPVCATIAQAYEQTSARPFGCPWFSEGDKKRHPKPAPVSPAMTISEDMVERAAVVVVPLAFSKDDDGEYWCADSARDIARARATEILTAALQGSVVVPAKPFGYFYWKSNGDGTESPDFCEGEVPLYVRVVRGLTPLYTHPVSRHERGAAT
jgi:hypothetical protein